MVRQVNHYEDYSWDELVATGKHSWYQRLGWSKDHWEHVADTVPYTEARWWGQLTDDEKTAANQICFFEENWDKVDMNPNPTYFPHPMPSFRYRPWDELNAVTRQVATGMLGYDEDSWNYLGTSIAEKNTFLNLNENQRAGAMDLGECLFHFTYTMISSDYVL